MNQLRLCEKLCNSLFRLGITDDLYFLADFENDEREYIRARFKRYKLSRHNETQEKIEEAKMEFLRNRGDVPCTCSECERQRQCPDAFNVDNVEGHCLWEY